jgi:hypothetical protein
VLFVEAEASRSPVLVKELEPALLPVVLIYEGGRKLHASEGVVGYRLLEEKLRGFKAV